MVMEKVMDLASEQWRMVDQHPWHHAPHHSIGHASVQDHPLVVGVTGDFP